MKATLLKSVVCLMLATPAIAAPLQFSLMENNQTRMEKFERHFSPGLALDRIQLGKKTIPLPEGKWLVKQSKTFTGGLQNDDAEHAGTTAGGEVHLKNSQNDSEILVELALSRNVVNHWLGELDEICLQADSTEPAFKTLRSQRDLSKPERQSCVKISAAIEKNNDDATEHLAIQTAYMESREGDYVRYSHFAYFPLSKGQSYEQALQQAEVKAHIAQQSRWASDSKAALAKQQGW